MWARIPGPRSATAPWWEGKGVGMQQSPSNRSPSALQAPPQPGISPGTGSTFRPLRAASCPFAAGEPAQARAAGLHSARCVSSELCV